MVIYFYPRDNTPGCTQEGEDFAGAYAQFKKAKALIVGISPDSLSSRTRNSRRRWAFPFELLSDPEQEGVQAVRRDPGEEHVRQEISWASSAAHS